MPAVTATNVRAARAMALLACFQSAKGTAASNFTTTDTTQLWTAEDALQAGQQKSTAERGLMTSGAGPGTTERTNVGERPMGELLVHATPASLEWLLRSNWGTYSGGAFTLLDQVAATQWLTIAYVENTLHTSAKLVRISDAWFHRLALEIRPPQGIVEVRAAFAGEVVTPADLSGGGVTLPSTYTPDRNVFAGATAILTRDPSSANVQIRLYSLDLVLDQGLHHEWDMMRGKYTVYKTGRPEVLCRFGGVISDETWAILTNSRAGTKQQFRIVATAPSPSKTLTINLYEMDFEIRDLGRIGQETRAFEAVGRAHVSGSNYVSITLA